ncbi:hypothetical protein SAMN02745248_02258 [Hathewaya proteolytica DSM 3090]|uniref:Uncharacterized protein n=1 Tax=Hathewaya proteolytica DSM 3090 TaxID=1121331 RepID=A0A1M6RCK6_9CLOT|nr:hypothetical protein [Hathewaya proteolytica]SHK30225.1 hypothetical protein SAMN02745248_02258 [Hathewaya proteolytica DSM 3090]
MIKKILNIIITFGAVIIVNLFLIVLHFVAIVPLAFNDSGITYMPWLQLIFVIIMFVLPLIVTYIAGVYVVKRLYKDINKIVYLAFAIPMFMYYSYSYIRIYQPDNILISFLENNSLEREYKSQQMITNKLGSKVESATKIITTQYNGAELSLLYNTENFYFYYKDDIAEKDIIQETSTEIMDSHNCIKPTLLLNSPKDTIIFGSCNAFKTSNGKVFHYNDYVPMILNTPKAPKNKNDKFEKFYPDTIIYDAMLKTRFKISSNSCIYDGTVGYYEIKLNEQGLLEIASHIPTINGTEGNISGINYYVNGIKMLCKSDNISLCNPKLDFSVAKRDAIETAQKKYGIKLEDIHTIELCLQSFSTLTSENIPCSNVLSVSLH